METEPQESAIGKFFNSFPPVVTAIVVGVLLLLMMYVPATMVTLGAWTFNLQQVATVIGVPLILMLAKALGVNMTTVYEVVKLGGKDMPQAAADAGGPLPPPLKEQERSKVKRWLTP